MDQLSPHGSEKKDDGAEERSWPGCAKGSRQDRWLAGSQVRRRRGHEEKKQVRDEGSVAQLVGEI